MNINEECLLKYLNNPKRLDLNIEKLSNQIFSLKSNPIVQEKMNTKIRMADAL